MYYIQCRTKLALRGRKQEKVIWNNIRSAQRPIVSKDKTVLFPPYVVVCHTTRYRESSLCGITRILGIGKFGEFATFTLEEATHDLLSELDGGKKEFDPGDVFAEYEETRIVGVLRVFQKTNPGKRVMLGATTVLISPGKDLDLDVDKCALRAKKKYKVE
jgi:hypothetical protein